MSQSDTDLYIDEEDHYLDLRLCWKHSDGIFNHIDQARGFFRPIRLSFRQGQVILLKWNDYLIISVSLSLSPSHEISWKSTILIITSFFQPSGSVCLGIHSDTYNSNHGLNIIGGKI